MLIPYNQNFAARVMEWQVDPDYALFFRNFERYFSLAELQELPMRMGAEIMIYFDDETKEATGLISLTYAPHSVVDMGLLIEKNSQHKGHAAKMATQGCEYLRRVRNIRKVTCHVVAEDERTLKGSLANGFIKEGVLKWSTYVNGKYQDEILLGKFL